MKKFTILSFAFFLAGSGSYAQWEPDVRLTNNPAVSNTSSAGVPCIAASGHTVHVVWFDTRDGNKEIYYKRSADDGSTWGEDLRLTNDAANSQYPSISVSGLNVHVVWSDTRDGSNAVYYKKSSDGGLNWEADKKISNGSTDSYHPVVASSGSAIHVVWYDIRDGNREVYYKRSTDGGSTWGDDKRLTNDPADSWYPLITASASVVHVVWYDGRDGNSEIYYKRSGNAGVDWGADTRLTFDAASSTWPAVSASGTNVYVAWVDDRIGNNNREIYYKRSTDNGLNWGEDIRLTNDEHTSFSPAIAASNSCVHVVWYDNRDGNGEIYYKRSLDEGLTWEEDTRLTNNIYESEYPSLSFSGSLVHALWQDRRDANYEIYYKRYIDGNPIGIDNENLKAPDGFSLSQIFPNPFSDHTTIVYLLEDDANVKISIFNYLGKVVEVIVNKNELKGKHQVEWNAGNLPAGVYFIRLTNANKTAVNKFVKQ